ncbi:MAG: hypothetical protein KME47_22685 [Nodosilinea sp. WJT8-NPBG4]|jgi:hypothetical protein|nr:hypothetical protein [Nodosilinea sp. WJT8-NPBG4]
MTLRLLWVWLRYGRRQLYPWLVLTGAGWQWLLLCGVERDRAAIRWMSTLVKIDGVKLTALLNDLLW